MVAEKKYKMEDVKEIQETGERRWWNRLKRAFF